MKYLIIILFSVSFFGCNQQRDTKNLDKKITADSTTAIPDSTIAATGDSVIMSLSHQILTCIKKSDFNCLSEFVHPVSGLRFSPYGYIDTSSDKVFLIAALKNLSKNKTKTRWGTYDGSGEDIILTPDAYLKKFVYDVDFLNAKEKNLNTSKGGGTTLNNIDSIYPSHSYTEFYFPGFDPKFDGMDWRALRLVFKKESGRYYLVAIIHDQWAI